MKYVVILTVIAFTILNCSSKNEVQNIKSLLVQQLKNTHTRQEWFAPTKMALEGLTAEQSNWKDSTENHSIAELVSHLIFWNEMNLNAFKGQEVPEFSAENEVTFNTKTEKDWFATLRTLDSIQTEWEKSTVKATNEQLMEWSTEIANMTAHNAYHTGQIVYIRKRQGWWK